MDVSEKIRLTEAQEAKLNAGGVVTIPATWEEFWEFLQETEYRAEYHNEKIIVMGLAAFIHEILVATVIRLLGNFYAGKGYIVAGSNTGVKIETSRKGYYNPDVTVVKGIPHYWNDSIAVITNPYLVVKVLSESTYDYDVLHKSRRYEQMESLVEVVFVDRFDQSVFTYRRTDTPNVWLKTIYTRPDEVARMGECSVVLREVFAGLPEGAE